MPLTLPKAQHERQYFYRLPVCLLEFKPNNGVFVQTRAHRNTFQVAGMPTTNRSARIYEGSEDQQNNVTAQDSNAIYIV